MSSLYDQFISAGGASVDPNNSLGGIKFYTGNTPIDPFNPQPASGQIPFWDVPSATLDQTNVNQNPWDCIYFADQLFPGIARVSGKRTKRVDKKPKKGNVSPTLTYVGDRVSEFDVTISIWTKPQWDLLQSLMAIILPKPGLTTTEQSNQSVSIYYPSLALAQISACVVESINMLEVGTPKGVWNLKIHCLEWRPPSKADVTTTPTGAQQIYATTAIKSQLTNQNASNPKPSSNSVGP